MPGFVSKHSPILAGGLATTVSGSEASITVATGFGTGRPLRTVVANIAGGSTTPGDGARLITHVENSNGSITFYLWKAAAADPTLEAATATCSFYWFALCD